MTKQLLMHLCIKLSNMSLVTAQLKDGAERQRIEMSTHMPPYTISQAGTLRNIAMYDGDHYSMKTTRTCKVQL